MGTDKEIALLFGILAGDGCLSRVGTKHFISITGNFYDDKPFFEQVVIPTLRVLKEKEVKYRNRQKHGKIEINFTDRNLFMILSEMGFPIGKKGRKLSIPQSLQGNLKCVISGYFATDGSLVLTNNNGILYPRLEIQSLSENILQQVRTYLNSLGMNGGIYTVKGKRFRTIYRLQFNGITNLVKFEKNIGFINPKHRDKFENYMTRRGSLVVERHSFLSRGDAHKRL